MSPRRSLFALRLLCSALVGCEGGDKATADAGGALSSGGQAVDADGDGAPADEDCDDSDPSVAPGAPERCDGIDNDCDGIVDNGVLDDFFIDNDGDGFGDAAVAGCAPPQGAVPAGGDCDDADPDAFPGADEVCDGADQDCDGEVDEGLRSVWYADGDGDGYGDPSTAVEACAPPPGFVAADGDCDDAERATRPGAVEVCDEQDNDCDGEVDEGVSTIYYADRDGDGFGLVADSTEACVEPVGYAASAGDCDDSDGGVSPAADERCDGQDNDCDGEIDESSAIDAPTFYRDGDGDGAGDPMVTAVACAAPAGFVAAGDDCNDGLAGVHPGAAEVCGGADEDCDGLIDDLDPSLDLSSAATYYADVDRDGYGDAGASLRACSLPAGAVTNAGDCDDLNNRVSPAAAEICNLIDDDCDALIDDADPSVDSSGGGTYYTDDDGDGYGELGAPLRACRAPAGSSTNGLDCDDARATRYPGAAELCNDEDDDCDAEIDEGLLGVTAACAAESCAEVVDRWPSAPDGVYQLNPAGAGARAMVCDMTTDGGGWTQVLDWDRLGAGDTKAELLALMPARFNNMSTFTQAADHLFWQDANAAGAASADALALRRAIDVPNGGELRYDLTYTGASMEQSATYFFAETTVGHENIECWDGVTTWSDYSTAERAERPSFTCGETLASTGSSTFSWSGFQQAALSGSVSALRLTSFHYDSCCDYSYLYLIDVWVR